MLPPHCFASSESQGCPFPGHFFAEQELCPHMLRVSKHPLRLPAPGLPASVELSHTSGAVPNHRAVCAQRRAAPDSICKPRA
eukprot:1382475-Amphidinium_carterae.1